jgi:hypothetical protein
MTQSLKIVCSHRVPDPATWLGDVAPGEPPTVLASFEANDKRAVELTDYGILRMRCNRCRIDLQWAADRQKRVGQILAAGLTTFDIASDIASRIGP